ncbi:MAG: hypothetical protein ACRD2L_00440 [Terriglobia bacterium]
MPTDPLQALLGPRTSYLAAPTGIVSTSAPRSGYRSLDFDPGQTIAANLPALQQGYASLLDILRSGGRRDPRMLAGEISEVERGSEQAGRDIEGALAARGLSGARAGQAAAEATRFGGTVARASLVQREAAAAEQRRREALDMVLRLVFGPAFQERELTLGARTARHGLSERQGAGDIEELANLLQSVSSLTGA